MSQQLSLWDCTSGLKKVWLPRERKWRTCCQDRYCTTRLSESLCYDGKELLNSKIGEKMRCAGDGCKAKKSAGRTECDVGLIVDCVEDFHKIKLSQYFSKNVFSVAVKHLEIKIFTM